MTMNKKPHVKLADLLASKSDPWNGDKLDRKSYAPLLTSVISDEVNPLVIAVNGRWGSGKTFFLKRWYYSLLKDSWAAVYFDSWADDFLDDPLLAIIGQMHKNLHIKYKDSYSAVAQGASDFLKRMGRVLLAGANDAVAHATGVDAIKAVKEGASEFSAGVDEYIDLNTTRVELVKRMGVLADNVHQETGKPLVVIVDELDRCKPTFAIALLERVKHLFNLQHIVFILGVDEVQLGNTIKSVYGDIDVENYIRRFVDLEFDLPAPNSRQFIDYLFEEYKIDEYLDVLDETGFCRNEGREFRQAFCVLAEWNKLELREIEFAMKMFLIFVRTAKERHYSWPILAAFMIVLRIRNRPLYDRYVSGKLRAKDLVDATFNHAGSSTRPDDEWVEDFLLKVIYATYGTRLGDNDEADRLVRFGSSGALPTDSKDYPKIFTDGRISADAVRDIGTWAKRLNSQLHSGGGSTYGKEAVANVASRIENFKAPY